MFCLYTGQIAAKELEQAELEQKFRLLALLNESIAQTAKPASKINLHQLIGEAATKQGLPAEVLASVVLLESGADPCALSGKGAKGLGQIMDKTAAMLNIDDAYNPRQNLSAAARYFAEQLNASQGQVYLAAAAYNYGPKAIKAQSWPAETRHYVRKFHKRLVQFHRRGWRHYLPEYIPMTNRQICDKRRL